MMQMPALQLRDIKMPAEPGYWPLAPGWWVLIGCLLVLLMIALWLLWRMQQRRRRYHKMRLQLARLHQDYQQHQDQHRLASEVSELLRRFIRHRMQQSSAAALSGPEWLVFLSNNAGGADIERYQQALLSGPYDPHTEYDVDGLIQMAADFFRYNSRPRRQHV